MCDAWERFAVKSFDSIIARTRVVLKDHPLPMLFPQEPWSQEDLEVIASIFRGHVWLQNEVVTDCDLIVDWLERYAFHQRVRETEPSPRGERD